MKKILFISILLNAGLLSVWVYHRLVRTEFAQPSEMQISANSNKHQSAIYDSLLTVDSNSIVFIGTSITQGLPVTEILGCNYKNRGIGWNTTGQILSRLPSIVACHPKCIYFEMGTNDFNIAKLPVDSVYRNYIACLSYCANNSFATHIIAQTTPPVYDVRYLSSNDKIRALNKRIKDYCDGHGIKVIDLYAALVKNDLMNPEYSDDGVHPNWKGYKIWIELIKKS